MKVLLRDDVAGVGRRGDIVKVAGGFARNFLLPEGRAIVASDGLEGQAGQMRRGRDLREAQDRTAAEAQATILAGAVIPISARAGGGGRLFGSIGGEPVGNVGLVWIVADHADLWLVGAVASVKRELLMAHVALGDLDNGRCRADLREDLTVNLGDLLPL